MQTRHYTRQWLQHIVQQFRTFSDDENFVFINAWNNSGPEGCHLEPCRKWGTTYLEITRDVFGQQNMASVNNRSKEPVELLA